MELKQDGHRAGLTDQGDKYSPVYPADEYPDESQEAIENFDITDAVTVAADWLEASRTQPITKTQYKNLHRSGYVSSSAEEIVDSFGSWYYFKKASAAEKESRDRLKARQRTAAVRAIEEERDYGLVPDELLREVKAVEYCRVEDRGQERSTRNLKVSYLTDERATDEEILKRYARYTLINHLFEQNPPGAVVTQERIVNLCLGFTQRTGKPLAGFFSALKIANSGLNDYEIDEAIEELGIHDYLLPEARSEHLQRLLEIGNSSYKNPSAVVFAGTHATKSYLHWLKTRHKLETNAEQLVAEDFDKPEDDERPNELYGWSREECLKYGAWLVKLVQNVTGEAKINAGIIDRADEMGYGLASHRLIKRFGSLAKFYVELKQVDESVDARIIGQFKDCSIDDFAKMVAELGKDLGRKPTEEDIDARASGDPAFPSSHIMTSEGLSLRQIMDRAGWPDIYSWDLTDHENHGVKFRFANGGAHPTQFAWDYLSKNKRGPSAALMRYKYAGGFSEYKDRVQQRYEAEMIKHRNGGPSLADEANIEALRLPDDLKRPQRKKPRVSVLPYRAQELKKAA